MREQAEEQLNCRIQDLQRTNPLSQINGSYKIQQSQIFGNRPIILSGL